MDERIPTSASERRVADALVNQIEQALVRVGLLCRVFGRVKSAPSITAKLDKKGEVYRRDGRSMQDLFGVRVVVYFADDSATAQRVVKNLFDLEGTSMSDSPRDVFGPVRCNCIYRLPPQLANQSVIVRSEELVDDTFEVQFRTTFSEGWHEVEHDLRYKRPDDWAPHEDLSRVLNGVMATLETCDWSLVKIFDDLAHRHYKEGDPSAMIRARFRLRTAPDPTNAQDLWAVVKEDPSLNKDIYRSRRDALLDALLRIDGPLPITAPNIVYVLNRLGIKHQKVDDLMPTPVRDLLDRSKIG